MSDEIPGFPTIEQYFMKRYRVWALIGFIAVLAMSLAVADSAISNLAARTLLRDLEAGIRQGERGLLGGLLAKDRGGTLNIAPDAVEDYVYTWPDMHRIQERGKGSGYGRVPWTEKSAVWAARRWHDGTIEVTWTRLFGVRRDAAGIYALVIAAIAASFGASLLAASRGASRVSDMLGSAANVSSRISEGDMELDMEFRATQELSDMSDAVNQLASKLRDACEKPEPESGEPAAAK